jgi:hypothetical protein
MKKYKIYYLMDRVFLGGDLNGHINYREGKRNY